MLRLFPFVFKKSSETEAYRYGSTRSNELEQNRGQLLKERPTELRYM